MKRAVKRGQYHHGDLAAALIDTAVDLIAERGVAGFSLAEASRRLGVTVAAPYRHFADRDALLAAVAAQAATQLAAAVAAQTHGLTTPTERLAAGAQAYVRFAATHRALFQALFAAGLDKATRPELEKAAAPLVEALCQPTDTLCGGGPDSGKDLTLAVLATYHGHATLLLDGAFGPGEDAVTDAANRAVSATLALVAGRDAL
ncbi:TetR/AcrR family transcriptional regulator [Fodinicola feengrottensis]|uniref:TetR/AcrR family transcriptional regulator n=1 Tax=Fodinicola feengrottensis TaxID=435914 RepID=A0ABN2HJG3_9ACTN|nr:TetR/AcrR family transcriptional regulator [Fodinicola feengrottensis]